MEREDRWRDKIDGESSRSIDGAGRDRDRRQVDRWTERWIDRRKATGWRGVTSIF